MICIKIVAFLVFRMVQGEISINQTNKILQIVHQKCMTNNKDKTLEGNGNCKYRLDPYLGCLNTTLNNTIFYHPCPQLFFEKPNLILVSCNNGTWGKIDYISHCVKLSKADLDLRKIQFLYEHDEITRRAMDREVAIVHHKINIRRTALITRWVDVCVCFISFFVLLALIPLKNHRVMLHRNLIVSVFLLDILDLIHLLWLQDDPDQKVGCSYLFVIKLYFFMAQVSWMFNEGFFQFRQFYFVFVRKPYMWAYFVTGWVFPAVVVFGIYLPIMLYDPPFDRHPLCWAMNANYKWNYVVYVPAFLLLAFNMVFVTYIMWIIWSKLRECTVNELEKARKAARGFLILIFLLGGGYVFTIYGPKDCITFLYMQAFIIPSQGTLICIVQVVISREVWDSAMTKFKRFSQKYQLSRNRSLQSTSIVEKDVTSMSFAKRLSITISRFTNRPSMMNDSKVDLSIVNDTFVREGIKEVEVQLKPVITFVERKDKEGMGVENQTFEMNELKKTSNEYKGLLCVNNNNDTINNDKPLFTDPEPPQKRHNDIEDVMQGFEKQGVSLEPFHVDSGTLELYKSNAIDMSVSHKPKFDMSSDMYSGIMT